MPRKDPAMPLIPDDDIHFGDDERNVLVEMLQRGIESTSTDGSPTFLIPEPGQTVKKRFGRNREVLTGYTAAYSIMGPGKRHADDPTVINLQWTTPEPLDEATARRDRAVRVMEARLRDRSGVRSGLDRRCSLDHRRRPRASPARHTAGTRRSPAHRPMARQLRVTPPPTTTEDARQDARYVSPAATSHPVLRVVAGATRPGQRPSYNTLISGVSNHLS